MAIYNAIKVRHEKHRAKIKAHFAKKRAAAAKPKAAKTSGKPSALSLAIMDSGHNSSEAKVKNLRTSVPTKHTATSSSPTFKARDAATVKSVTAATKPTPKPQSASAIPTLKVPQADAHTGPAKSPATPSVGKVIAITAGAAVAAGAAIKLAKSGKPPTAPVVHGELAIQKGALAKTPASRIDVKGLGQRTPALSQTVHRETAKLAEAVRERVGDPYAKNRANVRNAIGAAERADARAATPKPSQSLRQNLEAEANKALGKNKQFYTEGDLKNLDRRQADRRAPENAIRRTEFDAAVKTQTAKNDAATARVTTPKPKAAITGSGPGKRRNEAKKAKFKASQVSEPGALNARQRQARMAHLEKQLKANEAPKVVTPTATPARRISAPRDVHPGRRASDKQATAKVKKAPTKTVEASGLTQTQRDAKIADLEKQLGQTKHPTPKASPAQVTGQQPKTNVDFKPPKVSDLPKTPARRVSAPREVHPGRRASDTPKPPKASGFKQIADMLSERTTYAEKELEAFDKTSKPSKPVILTAPKTVSEGQKKAADKKFYNKRDKKYRALEKTPDPKIPVTSVEVVTAQRAQAEADVIKAKKNSARMLEIQTQLKENEYSKTPSTPADVNKPSAAQKFGTTEAEVAKVARKIDTVKPSAGMSEAFAKQMKDAPPEVQDMQTQIDREIKIEKITAELKANDAAKAAEYKGFDFAKAKAEWAPGSGVRVRTGAAPITDIKAAIAKHERLPMPQPERRTTRGMAKTEQAQAPVKTKPTTPPKATLKEATHVTPPLTEAQRTVRSQEAFALKNPKPNLTSSAITGTELSVKSMLAKAAKGGIKFGLPAVVLSSMFAASKGTASYFTTKGDQETRIKTAVRAAAEEGGVTAVGLGLFHGAYKGAERLAKAVGPKKALAGKAGKFVLGKMAPPVAIGLTVHQITSSYGKEIAKLQDAKRIAAQEKKGSEAKYGTIEKATATRKRRKAKMTLDQAGKIMDKYK